MNIPLPLLFFGLVLPLISTAQPAHLSGVYYEIFVRSFYDSNNDGIGDLNGITQKLDYLNDGNPQTTTDLGISGIWLMPINDSPSYHGYDVSNYFNINPDYGTMDDFKNLLKEADKRGIKIIMDFVMNHCSVRHPWYQKAREGAPFYKDFFIWSDSQITMRGPWGQRLWHGRNAPYHYGIFSGGLPDLNFRHKPVQDSLFSAARFWIKEVGVDGFRLDAVRYLYENGPNLEDQPETLAFLKQFADSVRLWNPAAFTVGEAWAEINTAARYVNEGGLDYVFEFDLAKTLVNTAKSGNHTALSSLLSQATAGYPQQRFGIFLTNHDQSRVIDELGDDLKKAELAAKLYLLLPGIPYLYYGEELGMKGSKPDEHIRRPMAWNASPGGGFTTGKPWIELPDSWQSRNVEAAGADATSLLHTYRRFIRLRNTSKALSEGRFSQIPASDPSVFSFIRQHDDQVVLVIANLSPSVRPRYKLDFTQTGLKEKSYAVRPQNSAKKPRNRSLGRETAFDGINPFEVMVFTFRAD